MRRVLCVRFPNWPIQRLQRQLRIDGQLTPALALHTPHLDAPGKDQAFAKSPDLRYIRGYFPAAAAGPAIVAVSLDAWTLGVRPGMPLAEARSMAVPVRPGPSTHGRSGSTLPGRPRHRGTRSAAGAASEIHTVEFHEWQPQVDRSELAALAELTRRFAPVVGLDAVPLPDSLLLDITGCAPLFGGESSLAECLFREIRNQGWMCRIAITGTISAAWAFTHSDSSGHRNRKPADDSLGNLRDVALSGTPDLPIQIIPPGQDKSEIRVLPLEASRIDLKDLEVLGHLGIRTIGQFLTLPREDLPSRLSADAVTRFQQLSGIVDEPITPLPESDPVAADWGSDEPAAGIRDLVEILRHLTERISEQLIRRRMAALRIFCQFRCDNGTIVPLTASVIRPTQSAELLLEILSLRLETEYTYFTLEHEPRASEAGSETKTAVSFDNQTALLFTRAVSRVSIQASIVALPAARQKDLFSDIAHVVPQEEVATLLSRLASRLGTDSVLVVESTADPRPERAFQSIPVLAEDSASVDPHALQTLVARLTEPVTDPGPAVRAMARPLRLIHPPQPAGPATTTEGVPAAMMFRGQRIAVRAITSAERLQTAWWTEEPCHRDYFQVEAANGARFWIFQDLHSRIWYLHGIFD